MWSFSQFSSHIGPRMGPFGTGQKREFGFLPGNNVPIVPGKAFQNPNFVNKHHPYIHNYDLSRQSVRDNCHIDVKRNVIDNSTIEHNSIKNSSQSILSTLKEKHLDIVKDPEPNFLVDNSVMQKHIISNQNYTLDNMMEVDVDSGVYTNDLDSNMSLIESNMLENGENLLTTLISVSPTHQEEMYIRERQISVAESEDSFIVFDSGTDEELEFSEEESEDETDEAEVQDDFDSTSSVIPCKRVRFAENDELCKVHPMIQWSYAYRNARKGPWEEYGRDRVRFKKRICDTEKIISTILDCKHRERVYKERFQEESIS